MLRRRAAAVLTAAVAALAAVIAVIAGAAPADAAGITYYAIGDSVLIDAQPSLHDVLPGMVVNAAVSRQVSDGITILQKKKRQKTVAGATVFGLGTNGTLSRTQLSQLISLTAGHKLIMVTTHCGYCSWTKGNNRVIRSLCTKAHHCWIAEFEVHAHYHPEWFTDDGVHMPQNGAGATKYAYYVHLACHNARISA